MTRLALVRHAATKWSGVRFCGQTDLPLSDVGRTQAIELAQRLAEARLTVATVRSSPAGRALETATLLADALGGGLETDERLREVDFGLAEGCTFDEIERRWPAIARSLLAGELAIDWPGGERASDVATRMESVARELEARRAGDVVLVTHGGPIRALAALLGVRSETSEALAPAQVLVLEREPRWHTVDLIAVPSDGRGGGVTWRRIRA